MPKNKPKKIVVTSQRPMIQVLIVDDHTIVRRGIKALLAETDVTQVVREADNGLDLFLMDLLIPDMDGVDAIR